MTIVPLVSEFWYILGDLKLGKVKAVIHLRQDDNFPIIFNITEDQYSFFALSHTSGLFNIIEMVDLQ